jgi:hypothetical protein
MKLVKLHDFMIFLKIIYIIIMHRINIMLAMEINKTLQ